MTLSDMLTELQSELDRDDIDSRILRWIQQSVDGVFNDVPFINTRRSATLTATASQETLSVPLDLGEIGELRYTPGTGAGHALRRLAPEVFFRRYPDQTNTGYPSEYCFFNNLLYLSPLPVSALTLTLHYTIASANIYTHGLPITDDDSAVTKGALIYLDEDGISTGVGKLLFVSPTTTDALAKVAIGDGHYHSVTIYHDADAATLGAPWYFDEDFGVSEDRNLFVSPTGTDCVVQTGITRKHSHYVRFVDSDTTVSDGVAVYCDEDASDKAQRLLFVSPTDSDGLTDLLLSEDGSLPPFLERYHEAVFLHALAKGLRFLGKMDAANYVKREAIMALGSVNSADMRVANAAVEAKPFESGRGRGIWDSLRNPPDIA